VHVPNQCLAIQIRDLFHLIQHPAVPAKAPARTSLSADPPARGTSLT
jgi:hypothetical protein